MRPVTKRLVFAVLGGVLIPICYSIILFPTFMLFSYFDLAHFDRNSRLASLPIIFPVWLGDFSGILPADNFVGNAALFIIGGTDFLVYALLTYSILWFRSRRAAQ
jgi:hypothetical protein